MKQDKIEITEAKLKNILGGDWGEFRERIFNSVYCSNCDSNYDSTIINYRIFLNDLNDIILEGFCKKCMHRVARYCETGEVPGYMERITELKKALSSIN